MKLSGTKYIFYVTLILACGYGNAGSIAKREADDEPNRLSQIVDTFISYVRRVPLIGSIIGNAMDWVLSAISLFEVATNRAIGRFLGGALPCTMALDGITCSGLQSNGGFGKLLMNVMNGIPSLILPGFFKSLMSLLIRLGIDPTVDVLLGGVAVNS